MSITPEPSPRVEREVHEAIWNAVHRWGDAESAITQARRTMYALLEDAPGAKDAALHWLDKYGVDTLREIGLREKGLRP